VADPEVADADTVALRHFNEVLHGTSASTCRCCRWETG